MYIQDGQEYVDEAHALDIGSWKAYNVDNVTNRRDYNGLSADITKLPVYDNLGNGSTALCVDTSEVYMYHSTDKTWYQL